MKIFRELIFIFGFYFLGEVIHTVFHLPLPGSLIGMVLLFIALQMHVIRLDQVKDTADFLLLHLPFFFIPAGVSLMSSFYHVQAIWMQIFIVCFLTTIITMAASGFIIQKMMERQKSS